MRRLPERDPPALRAPRKTAVKSALLRRRWRPGSTRRASGGQFGATLMATRGQDGAAGAGTHAQAEAMGLGPTAVVRLEGALAHEVLRYCTAIRRSVLKVVRGSRWDGSARWTGCFKEMIGRNRRPAATNNAGVVTRAGENGRQHRSRSRYGSGCRTVKLVPSPEPAERPMLACRAWRCQATRRATHIFLTISDRFMRGPGCCEGRVLASVTPHPSSTPIYTVCG